jgi:hypothetical protein
VKRCLSNLIAFFKQLFSVQTWAIGWTFRGSICRRNERFFSFSEMFRMGLPPPHPRSMCADSSNFEGKAAVVWIRPLICSQCWGIEWVELYLNCSRHLNGVHSHNFSLSPHTTTVSTVDRLNEGFP